MQVIDQLAADLRAAFPGVRGFSARNLRYMRDFYRVYSDYSIWQAMLAKVSWTHHLEILKCKTEQEREFYLRMASKHVWSYRVLGHHIDTKAYERWLLGQTNFDITLATQPQEYRGQAKLAVRDDYNFDFLELAEPHLERELEEALVSKIAQFLGELGGYFAFIGRQYRIEIDDKEFFLDLLFYNRELRCLMAVELKTGEFEPEYGSKMNFYLSALDDKVKLPHENPSIGLIICRSKSRTIVEYTLKDVNKPIAVATYNHYATLKDLPERIARYLPSPEDIKIRLEEIPE
ncbi:MAG: PDDEXK nuclease domain-containing protein [Chloroflexota bacterium]